MIRIPDAHLARAIWLVDEADTAALLEDLLRFTKPGAPSRLSLRTLAIGMYLTVEATGTFQSKTIHETLTSGLSVPKQLEFGTRWTDPRTGDDVTLTKANVDYRLKSIGKRAYSTVTERTMRGEDDVVTDAELQRRATALTKLCNRLVAASIIGERTGWYALDGSGIKSHGRPMWPEIATDVRNDPDGDDDDQPTAVPALTGPTGRTVRREVDANHGSKTGKAGGRDPYFGFMLDAAVRIPRPGGPKVPIVVEAFSLIRASADVVAPSLGLLEYLQSGGPVTDIVVDRHYPYKAVERWGYKLMALGIDQHFDLRSDEQRFFDANGAKVVAGRAHCPATPEEHGDIPRPGFRAGRDEWDTFKAAIERRRQWEMRVIERPRASNGHRIRVECPAITGQVGCPLRAGTVEVAEADGRLPIVTDAPDPTVGPACCTNRGGSMAIRSERLNKHWQPHTWGSREWEQTYKLRTYVEGYFGSLKCDDTESVGQGFTRFTGLARNTLGLAFAIASTNLRHQNNFWRDDPSVEHPLLVRNLKDPGWIPAAA
jgi:hypothetical protein